MIFGAKVGPIRLGKTRSRETILADRCRNGTAKRRCPLYKNQSRLTIGNEGPIMKKTMLTTAVLGALMAGNAMAADLRTKAPILKAPPPPAFSWTGCYLDAGVGYGLWDQEHSVTFANSGATNIETTTGGRGWLGRFGGGCDLQLSGTLSNFVVGVFGDYDLMDLTGTMTTGGVTAGTGTPIIGDEKESSAWAVGGRIGYAVAPQVLTYVDGGWTQTRFDQVNLKTEFTGAPTGFAFSAHDYNGWFLGGGVEYNFTWLPIQGLFLRTEYRYSSYNRDDLTEFNIATGAPSNILHSRKFVQTVTTSLVWRFNWFR
jgi:outer membrane immunogenic protein